MKNLKTFLTGTLLVSGLSFAQSYEQTVELSTSSDLDLIGVCGYAGRQMMLMGYYESGTEYSVMIEVDDNGGVTNTIQINEFEPYAINWHPHNYIYQANERNKMFGFNFDGNPTWQMDYDSPYNSVFEKPINDGPTAIYPGSDDDYIVEMMRINPINGSVQDVSAYQIDNGAIPGGTLEITASAMLPVGYVVVARHMYTPDENFILCYDSNLDLNWVKKVVMEDSDLRIRINGIHESTPENMFLTGEAMNDQNNVQKPFVMKLAQDVSQVHFMKIYDYTGNSDDLDMENSTSSNNGVQLGIRHRSSFGIDEMAFAHVDANGQVIQAYKYNTGHSYFEGTESFMTQGLLGNLMVCEAKLSSGSKQIIDLVRTDQSDFACNSSIIEFESEDFPVVISDVEAEEKSTEIEATGFEIDGSIPDPIFNEVCSEGIQRSQISSQTVIEESHNPEIAFLIFPNPATDVVNIQIEDMSSITVQVFNAMGQQVEFDQNITNNLVEIRGLKRGMYILRIESGSEIFTERVVIK